MGRNCQAKLEKAPSQPFPTPAVQVGSGADEREPRRQLWAFAQEEPHSLAPSCPLVGPHSFLLDGGPWGREGIKGRRRVPSTARRPSADTPGRPEAMLLLLTLALLGSPISWADDMVGHQGGHKYFSTPESCCDLVTGIRVATDIIGKIISIQVKVGDSWQEKAGVSGGHIQEFELWPGEMIKKLNGSFKLYMRQLCVHTSEERSFCFGKESGTPFTIYPKEKGQSLTGIYGHYDLLGFKNFGFRWGFLPDDECE
ncbi:zymogen granule protein 16 homolog B [Carlito syrichta]|uniref:Zymogen granule protein 16 homolog B n=1 Tax=Carlito syrichta TaxID=1868482 RepID=A0A3Q0E3F3_CARSF|nr:zymogen granule protein 16 homolog B [Carlito syrichta]